MGAEATLKLLLLGEDRSAGKSVRGLGDDAEKSHSKLQGLSNVAGKALAAGLLVAGAAAVKFGKAAAEDQASASKMAQTFQRAAGATKAQVDATEDWITAQGKAKGVADDELRPALSKLITATHDVGKAQQLATLAMDISAGSGKSLEAVSAALARAQNGNVGALSRLGIKVKDSVKDNAALEAAQIRVREAQQKYTDAVDEHGVKSKEAELAASKLEYAQTKLGEAQGKTKTRTIDADEAMKRLSDTYGGAAAKAADTAEGKQKRLSVALSEAGESIGYKLLPAMLKLTEIATAALGWMTEHQRLVGFIAAAVVGLVTAVWAINAASRAYAATQAALNVVLSANPIGLVVLAIGALVAAFVIAYKHSETFRNIVNGAFHAVVGAAQAAFGWVREHWPLILGILTGPFGLAVLAIAKNWDKVTDGARDVLDFIKGMPGKIRGFFDGVWDGLAGGLKSAINAVLHLPLKIPVIDTHIPGVGKVGGQTLIPALASGGIVTRPTLALVGEAGPEAVVPLSQYRGGSGGDLGTLTVIVKSDTGEMIEQKLVKLKRDQGGRPLGFVV